MGEEPRGVNGAKQGKMRSVCGERADERDRRVRCVVLCCRCGRVDAQWSEERVLCVVKRSATRVMKAPCSSVSGDALLAEEEETSRNVQHARDASLLQRSHGWRLLQEPRVGWMKTTQTEREREAKCC